MRTNLNYKSKNFYVNKAKKTVVCTLTSVIDLDKLPMKEYLDGDFDFWDKLEQRFEVVYADLGNSDKAYIKFNTTGKSKAHGTDEFNEELGRYAALTRAQENAFYQAYKLYFFVSDYINEKLNSVNILAAHSLNSALNCNKHVKEILNID